MTDTLVFMLPEIADAGRAETHWWLVAEGVITAAGVDADWPGLLVEAGGERRRQVALAPASAVRVEVAAVSDATASPRQAAAIARIAAVEHSLGDPATLHAVTAVGSDGTAMSAVVGNGTMLEWLEWATSFGADPDQIVPVATLVPITDGWCKATIGGETLVARGGVAFAFDPGLAEAIVGDAEVSEMAPAAVDEALVGAATGVPRIDLRSGRFARRRRMVIERGRIRELAILALMIPLLTLLSALAGIAQLNASSDRLDAETLRIAGAAIGRAPSLESAEAELAQTLGAAASGGSTPAMAALFQQLQAEQGVSSTELSYRADGTLAVTLAAPTVDEINRLLVALQRHGHVISAVPRQASDGRAMADVTVRGRQ